MARRSFFRQGADEDVPRGHGSRPLIPDELQEGDASIDFGLPPEREAYWQGRADAVEEIERHKDLKRKVPHEIRAAQQRDRTAAPKQPRARAASQHPAQAAMATASRLNKLARMSRGRRR